MFLTKEKKQPFKKMHQISRKVKLKRHDNNQNYEYVQNDLICMIYIHNSGHWQLTVRSRFTPLRPAAKCPSCALLPEREKIDTGDPSS